MFYNSNINVDPNSNNKYTAAELREYYSIEAANRLISAQHSDYLLLDGSVKALGYNDNGKSKLRRLHNIKSIAAGLYFTCGLTHDGTVQSTGIESGDPTLPDISDVVAIDANNDFIVILKKNGTVIVVKDDGTYQNEIDTSSWNDIVQVAAGMNHVLGLRSDGSVVAAGENNRGQCNIGTWYDIVSIAAGHSHSLGLRADGTVVAIGDNSEGQCNVGDWHDIIAISGSVRHSAAIMRGRSVVATKYFGNPDLYGGQCDVSYWKHNIIQISAGSIHTFAVNNLGYLIATECMLSDEFSSQFEALCDVIDLNDRLFVSYENLFNERTAMQEKIRLENEIRQKAEAQAKAYRAKGLCSYCGGEFKGMIIKKCSKCGRKKNY